MRANPAPEVGFCKMKAVPATNLRTRANPPGAPRVCDDGIASLKHTERASSTCPTNATNGNAGVKEGWHWRVEGCLEGLWTRWEAVEQERNRVPFR